MDEGIVALSLGRERSQSNKTKKSHDCMPMRPSSDEVAWHKLSHCEIQSQTDEQREEVSAVMGKEARENGRKK